MASNLQHPRSHNLVPLNGLAAYIASNGNKTTMKRLTFIIPLILSLLALTDCYRADLPDSELVGTLWTLESIDDPAAPIYRVESGATVNIRFSEELRVQGINFCNSYFAAYDLGLDGEIKIELGGTTLVYCDTGGKEADYFQALPLVHSYNIDGPVLRLYYDDDSVLLYRDETP